MKERRAWQVFWGLLILSLLTKTAYEVWNLQRPSDEQVQRRMSEELEAAPVGASARYGREVQSRSRARFG